ncbi:hypothetical protein PPL_05037 [Heterostelium album PN500]|uniref:SKICH domain-containing protein n=1 Tax=Heterostelium pallidum (strain ATCC 26659 / Pp 5 / PN500) TaxID=670386 RepID=D3B993_HETP5|nr:hypothetical protein PPL_05037 [Heterostelium album PN500]EFA82132.1 hypothetical protein PPL_05037 [Heterostelium album PN500]|eukprot:XP_020434249.1 hypothetical protein PPL_05037 [Heterostelium album PN500]
MEDLHMKITALADIFTLFDKETITEVLAKHNNKFDAAAAELAETEPPKKKQPQQQQPPAPVVVQQPVAPPPQYQQPRQPAPAKPQPMLSDKRQVYKEIKNIVGEIDPMQQSAIFDVYTATGGKIQETAQIVHSWTTDEALEEQKRVMEIMEKERESLRLAKEEQLRRHQQMIQQQKIAAEKERAERDALEQKRLDLQRVEQERREKERLVLLMREQELIKQEEEKQRQEQERKRREQVEQDRLLKLLDQEREQHQKALKAAQEQEQRDRQFAEKLQKEQEEAAKLEAERTALKQALQKHESERKKLEEQAEQAKAQKEKIDLEMKKKQEEEIEKQKRIFEKQQKELIEQQIALEAKRQKELEHNKELLRLHDSDQRQLEELKNKLDLLQRNQSEEEMMKKHEIELKRQNELELVKHIEELERQKVELQKLQALELDIIQREKEKLEKELVQKLEIIEQTKLSNTLSLKLTRGTEADTIVVNYNLGNQIHSHCWIGIYPTHQPKNERYLTYKVVEGGNDGSITYPGIIPGNYEARLFKDKYDLLQTSDSILIGPDVDLSAHVVGDEIHIKYNVAAPSSISNRDWIGLYSKGLRNKKYIDSTYANNTGTAIFKSPRTPGEYSVRYFVYPTKYNEQTIATFEILDLDQILVTTPIVSKGKEIKVEYSVNTVVPSSSDWIGLYVVGEENNKNYIESKYTNGTGNGVISFVAPEQQGEFEVRFFSSYKDDNIDKIVFSLLSKKLYDNRNSFLYIPLNITDKTTRCMIKNLKLRSFVNQIESYDHQDDAYHKIKTIISVHLAYFSGYPKVFSSYIGNDKLEQIKESDISDDIEEIIFTRDFDSLHQIPAIKRIESLSVSLTSPINYAIPNNITSLSLSFYSSQSFGENAALPSQLESLTIFSSLLIKFEKGFLPLTLKKLRLVCSAPKFDIGVLPEGLESLKIEKTSFTQPITKGVLPRSLKSIGLESYSGRLVFYNPTEVNNNSTSDMDDTYIPNTIRMLMIGSPPNRDKKTLDLELPFTLKKFELGIWFNQKLGKFVVPNTLTQLKLKRSNQLEYIPATINFLCLKNINLEIGRINDVVNLSLDFINNILGGQRKVGFNWIGPSINTLKIPLSGMTSKLLESIPLTVTTIILSEKATLSVNTKTILRRLKGQRYLLFSETNQGGIIESKDFDRFSTSTYLIKTSPKYDNPIFFTF